MGLDASRPVLGGGGGGGSANNTGADQPVHPRSLISAIVIRFVEVIICKTGYRWNFNFLASPCSLGDWFETRFVRNPEDRFCRDEAQMILHVASTKDNF